MQFYVEWLVESLGKRVVWSSSFWFDVLVSCSFVRLIYCDSCVLCTNRYFVALVVSSSSFFIYIEFYKTCI